jgi:DNA-binding response OmpR family regulator
MYLETEGMKVMAAADGHQVQHLVEEACRQFDLYILDVMMPGPDGYELCRRLRRRTDVPIILLTARDTEQDKVLGLGVGADDYVTKPFSPLELVARVKAHLRRFSRLAGSQSEGILQCGSVTIDTRARRVSRNGCEVELTAKEYRILEYLAQNAGRVLTRAQIFLTVALLSRAYPVPIGYLILASIVGVFTVNWDLNYLVPWSATIRLTHLFGPVAPATIQGAALTLCLVFVVFNTVNLLYFSTSDVH